MKYTNVMITGTGSFVPENVVTNQDFAKNKFFDVGGKRLRLRMRRLRKNLKRLPGLGNGGMQMMT